MKNPALGARSPDRTNSSLASFMDGAARLLRRTLVSPRHVFALVAIAAACMFAGLVSVYFGNLVAQRPVLFLGLPLLLAVGFMLLISPKALIIAIILLRAGMNPIFDGAQIGNLGGLGGIVNLGVILLAVIFIVREPGRIPKLAWLAWIPFMTLQLIGIGYSPESFQQVRPWLAQFSTFAMYLIAFHLVDDFASLIRIFRLILYSSFPVVLLCLADRAGLYHPSTAALEGDFGRMQGGFAHPNILAFYLLTIIGVVFFLWKYEKKKTISTFGVFAGLYLILLLGLLGATQTRSAWVGAAALFLIYGIFFERRYLVYLAVLPALAVAFVPEVRDRVLDLGKGNEVVQYAQLNSFAWRKLLWEESLQWMSPARYIMGYGTGAFRFYAPQFFSLAGGINWGAHSVFVQVIFELGVVGLVSFMWIFWSCGKLLTEAFKYSRLLASLFMALLICQLVVSLSDNVLDYLVSNWYLWLVVGGVSAVAKRTIDKTPVPVRDGGLNHRF